MGTALDVTYDELIEWVAERAGLEAEEAERTSIIVLQELCDRITGDECRDLLAQLPAQLTMWIMVAPVPLPAPTDEFVGRVARVLGVREDEAEVHILAVFATLREAVTWGELEEMVAQLEPEDAVLLA